MEFRIVNESPNTYRLSFDYNDYEKEAKQIELCETSGFVKIDKTIGDASIIHMIWHILANKNKQDLVVGLV